MNTNIEKKQIRDSRFELLRIVAMILIILQHPLERSMENGLNSIISSPFSLNWCLASATSIWGQLGVILFIMISSWFMADRQGIKSKKVVMLFLQVWTTCIIMTAIGVILKMKMFSIAVIAKEVLTPVYKGHYWFITAFLAFFISVPILQKLVHVLEDRSLRNICIILSVLIPLYNCFDENVGSAWADFVYIFLVIAYLKAHPNNWFRKHCYLFILGIISIVLCLICCKLLIPSSAILWKLFSALRGRTLPMFIISLCVFYCFERMKPFYSKAINYVSGTMFGVYLIHENYLFRGSSNGNAEVWNHMLHIDKMFQSDQLFILKYIVIVLTVFIICILCEIVRKYVIERLYAKTSILNKICEKIDYLVIK